MTPEEAAAYLSDRGNAFPASRYPGDPSREGQAGLYSWWIDGAAKETLESSVGEVIGDLIYAGQAGASSTRSSKPSSATLKTRIYGQHLNGTAYGSTFRKTLSALLLEPLGLVVERPDRLSKSDNARVSAWIRDNLRIATFPFDDRDSLHAFENAVLTILNPPLNIQGMAPTPIRRRVSHLRKLVSTPTVVENTEMPDPEAASPTPSVQYFLPTGGPAGWQGLLADPKLHWVKGRSARTLAYAWENSRGWPSEVESVLSVVPELASLKPIYGFPEFKVPLPGGRRESQTDLMVVASDGNHQATIAVEGKVTESFGPPISEWLGEEPTPGQLERLSYLTALLHMDGEDIAGIRYQLLHRTASALIEAQRNGSSVAMMLVHSWGPVDEGLEDFRLFAELLGVDGQLNSVGFAEGTGVWLGWVRGDPQWLSF